MNPHTMQFEQETTETPASWARFAVGEVKEISGVHFVIEKIEAARMTLRPASPIELLGAGVPDGESYAQRLERRLREKESSR